MYIYTYMCVGRVVTIGNIAPLVGMKSTYLALWAGVLSTLGSPMSPPYPRPPVYISDSLH